MPLKYANSPDLPPLLRDFVNHEYAIRNKSALTVDEYVLDLSLFFRYLKCQRIGDSPALSLEKTDISDLIFHFFVPLHSATLTHSCPIVKWNAITMPLPARAKPAAFVRFSNILLCRESFWMKTPCRS